MPKFCDFLPGQFLSHKMGLQTIRNILRHFFFFLRNLLNRLKMELFNHGLFPMFLFCEKFLKRFDFFINWIYDRLHRQRVSLGSTVSLSFRWWCRIRPYIRYLILINIIFPKLLWQKFDDFLLISRVLRLGIFFKHFLKLLINLLWKIVGFMFRPIIQV